MMGFNRTSGRLGLDANFADATTNGTTVQRGCISWQRKTWPHGSTGYASPHSITFMDTNAATVVTR